MRTKRTKRNKQAGTGFERKGSAQEVQSMSARAGRLGSAAEFLRGFFDVVSRAEQRHGAYSAYFAYFAQGTP